MGDYVLEGKTLLDESQIAEVTIPQRGQGLDISITILSVVYKGGTCAFSSAKKITYLQYFELC